MRIVVRPIPVLIACAGCPAGGQRARDTAAVLDRRGLAEASWLGAADEVLAGKARSRFPVFAVDGCRSVCAQRWLAQHGVTPQRCYVLVEDEAADPERIAERIAAGW